MVHFNEGINIHSGEADMIPAGETFRELVGGAWASVSGLLWLMSDPDRELTEKYCRDGMTQVAVARLMGVSQGAVSRRIKGLVKKLRLLMEMPERDPVRVREEFKTLFGDDFEEAFVSYWESSSVRVGDLLAVSYATAKSRQSILLKRLESLQSEGGEVGEVAGKYFGHFERFNGRQGSLSGPFKSRKRMGFSEGHYRGEDFC